MHTNYKPAERWLALLKCTPISEILLCRD